MKLFVIAGEASADLHTANVIRQLKKTKPDVEIFGVGGDQMRRLDVELLYHCNDLAFLGFVEVLKHLPFMFSVAVTLQRAIQTRKPDAIILVDYPGFNLRFAQRLRMRLGEDCPPIIYYISPQVWAWNSARVPRIAKLVDKMIVIFPFEVELYQKVDLDTEFVGHPLLEEVDFSYNGYRDELCNHFDLARSKKIVGLLPGSRKQEIDRLLPVMLETVEQINDQIEIQPVLAIAPTITPGFIAPKIDHWNSRHNPEVKYDKQVTHSVMGGSDLLLVCSGTATLESGLFGTPLIVVYKVSPLSYQIGKKVIKIPNIGLVNIVAEERVVPEFVQYEAIPENIAPAAVDILRNSTKNSEIREKLKIVRNKLGEHGASKRTAEIICQVIEHT